MKRKQSRIVRKRADEIETPSRQEIERIKAIPESGIDFTDIPKIDLEAIYPRRMRLISFRVENDLLDWFKRRGAGYQVRMRQALRDYMNSNSTSGSQVEQIAEAIMRRLQSAQESKRTRPQPDRRRKPARSKDPVRRARAA